MLCPICATELPPTGPRSQVYCKPACRQAAYRRRLPELSGLPEGPQDHPRRRLLTQIQRARWVSGLPALRLDPSIQQEAELRAAKRLVTELQKTAKNRPARTRQLVREVRPDDPQAHIDPEATFVGIGMARSGRQPLVMVVLIGREEG